MTRFPRLIGTLLLPTVLVLSGCAVPQSALVSAYAFRVLEHETLTSPVVQEKIQDPVTRRKINALEGQFDSAFNCAYSAYLSQESRGPEAEFKASDLQPCLLKAWGATTQLLTTIRAFDPTFLTQAQDVTLPGGVKAAYLPEHFTSTNPPTNIPLAPKPGEFKK